MENELEIHKADCPYCGAPLTLGPGVDYLQCAYCGSQLLVQRDASFPGRAPAVSVQQPTSGERCPKCGRADTVAKVSAIAYRGGSGAPAPGPVPAGQGKLALQLAFPDVAPAPHAAAKRRHSRLLDRLSRERPGRGRGGVRDLWAGFCRRRPDCRRHRLRGRRGRCARFVHPHDAPGQVSPDAGRSEHDAKIARMKKIYQRVCYCSHCSIIWLAGRQSVYDPSELAVILHGVPQQ